MPFSVRLDAKTERVVTRLARQSQRTKSAIVREALEALERDHATASAGMQSTYAQIEHLIGVADSRDGRLSENTGERFRAMVLEKARARRSR
jgi:predicted transcriptional regulator